MVSVAGEVSGDADALAPADGEAVPRVDAVPSGEAVPAGAHAIASMTDATAAAMARVRDERRRIPRPPVARVADSATPSRPSAEGPSSVLATMLRAYIDVNDK